MPLPIIRDLLGQHLHKLRTLRARAHDRHLAFEHIKELWELVETDLPDETAHGCDPRIVLPRPNGSGPDLGIHAHGTEFIELEREPIHSDPPLAVENRALGGEAHREGGEEHQRKRYDNRAHGGDEVGHVLKEDGPPVTAELTRVDELRRAQFFHTYAPADALESGGGLFDDVAAVAELQQLADRQTIPALPHADHSSRRPGSGYHFPQRVEPPEEFHSVRRRRIVADDAD